MRCLLPSLGLDRYARSLKANALAIAIAVASIGVLLPASLMAQTASDNCGFLPANKYPVNPNGDCDRIGFDLATAWGGTPTYPVPSCVGVNRDDGFGWFTATGTTTTVEYTPDFNLFGPYYDAVLQILNGCSATPTQLGCQNAGGTWIPETVTIATVPGNNYVVRVQRVGSNSGMTGSLCIHSVHPPLPTTGDCTYTLTLNDANGNGWNNANYFGNTSTVEILINGVSYGTYTQTYNNGTAPITFGVNNGQLVQLIYDGSGPSQNQNSFGLTACSGTVLLTPVASPASGVDYSATVDCGHAPPTDCLGAVTVFGPTPVHNAISNSGCTTDITTSNHGSGSSNSCMASEGIGTWYYFSPTETGTLTFTITPSPTAANYDFSLWGPYGSAQCPVGPPIRCSVRSSTGATGLRTADNGDSFDTNNNAWASPLTIGAAQVGQVYVLYIKKATGTGQDFNLTFTGAALNGTVLPIELLDLYAQPRDQSVDVIWATASERNSERYEIQRSFDDSSYVTIGTLPAAGDAEYTTYYAFTDEAPGLGVANYYRLKEVDRDGAVTITRTVVALMDGATQVPVLFPNPATDMLNVSFGAFSDGIAVITVHDALGRIMKEQQSPVQRGQQTVRIPMDDLRTGCYSVQVLLPSGIIVRGGTFVKQ